MGLTNQGAIITEKTLSKSDLNQFTGTEQWYRHWTGGNFLYTDGIRHVAEAGGAFWLIDEIAFAQKIPAVAFEEFQTWKLTVSTGRSATLTCENGNSRPIWRKSIPFTDFPLTGIMMYFTGKVLLLPSEY